MTIGTLETACKTQKTSKKHTLGAVAATLAFAMSALLSGGMTNTANAAVAKTAAVATTPVCILALSSSATPAIEAGTGAGIDAFGCKVQVNSSSGLAVNLNGGAYINSAENCVVGNAYVQPGVQSSITPAPKANCKAMNDPFAAMKMPTIDKCDYTNMTINRPTVLTPGVYCGFTNVFNTTVLLRPGNYVIKDGFLNATQATIAGNGVSILFTGRTPGLTMGVGTTFALRANQTGPLAGFVFFMDPSASYPLSVITMAGRSTILFEGNIYLPSQRFIMSGRSALVGRSKTNAIIADRFLLNTGSRIVTSGDTSQFDLSRLDTLLPNFEILLPIIDALGR